MEVDMGTKDKRRQRVWNMLRSLAVAMCVVVASVVFPTSRTVAQGGVSIRIKDGQPTEIQPGGITILEVTVKVGNSAGMMQGLRACLAGEQGMCPVGSVTSKEGTVTPQIFNVEEMIIRGGGNPDAPLRFDVTFVAGENAPEATVKVEISVGKATPDSASAKVKITGKLGDELKVRVGCQWDAEKEAFLCDIDVPTRPGEGLEACDWFVNGRPVAGARGTSATVPLTGPAPEYRITCKVKTTEGRTAEGSQTFKTETEEEDEVDQVSGSEEDREAQVRDYGELTSNMQRTLEEMMARSKAGQTGQGDAQQADAPDSRPEVAKPAGDGKGAASSSETGGSQPGAGQSSQTGGAQPDTGKKGVPDAAGADNMVPGKPFIRPTKAEAQLTHKLGEAETVLEEYHKVNPPSQTKSWLSRLVGGVRNLFSSSTKTSQEYQNVLENPGKAMIEKFQQRYGADALDTARHILKSEGRQLSGGDSASLTQVEFAEAVYIWSERRVEPIHYRYYRQEYEAYLRPMRTNFEKSYRGKFEYVPSNDDKKNAHAYAMDNLRKRLKGENAATFTQDIQGYGGPVTFGRPWDSKFERDDDRMKAYDKAFPEVNEKVSFP
jgi:hypothetical protein